jgi:endonuclease-3
MNPLIPLILDHLFPDPPIPLNHTSPFTLLIAVLLSAQCTDIKVNQVTEKLFSFGYTPQDLLALGQEKIEQIIQPLGLYKTKARHIYKLCHILIDRYQGQLPEDLEELKTLPGVGHKTASCVMSQAFQKPAFAVDTHIHRLAKRWGLSSGKSVEQTEKDLKIHFRKQDWSRKHLQFIYYARSFCQAKAHHLDKCPICLALSLERFK